MLWQGYLVTDKKHYPNKAVVDQLREMSNDELAQHLLKHKEYLIMSQKEKNDYDRKIPQQDLEDLKQYQVDLVQWLELYGSKSLSTEASIGGGYSGADIRRNALEDHRRSAFSHTVDYLRSAFNIILKNFFNAISLDEFIKKYDTNKKEIIKTATTTLEEKQNQTLESLLSNWVAAGKITLDEETVVLELVRKEQRQGKRNPTLSTHTENGRI